MVNNGESLVNHWLNNWLVGYIINVAYRLVTKGLYRESEIIEYFVNGGWAPYTNQYPTLITVWQYDPIYIYIYIYGQITIFH